MDELYKFIMSLEIKTYPQLKVYTELLELPRDLLIEMLTMLKDGIIVYTDLIPSQLAISKYKLEEYQNQVYMTDSSESSPLSSINIYNNIRDLIISAFNVKLNRSVNDNIVSMNISDENVYKLNLVSKLSDSLSNFFIVITKFFIASSMSPCFTNLISRLFFSILVSIFLYPVSGLTYFLLFSYKLLLIPLFICFICPSILDLVN